MKKVKVQRYVSGKRPEYAPASSDEDESDADDFTAPKSTGLQGPAAGQKQVVSKLTLSVTSFVFNSFFFVI